MPASDDFHGAEPVAEVRQALSVAEAVSAGCSTTAVWGLSLQIIDQLNCVIPGGALAEVPTRPNFSKGGATLAWMQPPAVAALVAALDENKAMSLRANSMLRTVAQQYLLYRWYQAGQCSISLAATPGNSNHESGLAIDVNEWQSWQTLLEAHDFSWLGSNDAVHFDYEGSGVVDLSGKGVLAFQILWNANNPGDRIAEDGDYGPATASRLEQSPAEGFATSPNCSGGAGGNAGSGGAASGGTAGAGGVAGAAGSAGPADAGAAGGTGGAAGAIGGGGGGRAGMAGQSDSGATAGAGASSGSAGTAPASAHSGDDASGCTCAQVPDRRRPGGALALLALVLLGTRRRHRSPDRARHAAPGTPWAARARKPSRRVSGTTRGRQRPRPRSAPQAARCAKIVDRGVLADLRAACARARSHCGRPPAAPRSTDRNARSLAPPNRRAPN